MKLSQQSLDGIARLQREGRVTIAGGPPPESVDEAKTEKAFQAEVIQRAKRYGWKHYHTTISKRSAAGFPDLILIRPPRLIAAELKVGTNRLTADQETWLELFRGVPGLEVHVWRPTDWELIERLLSSGECP